MQVEVREGIAHISGYGEAEWNEVVREGHRLCKEKLADNVVLDDGRELPDLTEWLARGVVEDTDIVVVGAGVSGCGIARELCRHRCRVTVVEKCSDIGEGTTKGNNGMVHSGYDPKHGSLKALLNVQGNALFDEWARDLGFAFNRTGSFVCGFTDADAEAIRLNYENGVKNRVPGIAILDGDAAREIEPALADDITTVLWTPSAGYVEPYDVTLRLMESAIANGARLRLDCAVLGFTFAPDGRSIAGVVTTQGVIKCRHVVNAAGLYADDIAWYAGDRFYSLHPRRGVLVIFDKQNPCKPRTFAGMAPGPYTKGGGPQMTPDGTMLWGPSAEEVTDKDDLSVDRHGFDFVLEKGYKLFKGVAEPGVIAYFAGNRAASFNEDFIIRNSDKLANFTHVAGIQSPGLASAPAIARLVSELVRERLPLADNPEFNPVVRHPPPFRDLPPEERGGETIVCRCEMVTEREVVAAIHGTVPARTLDAVKRRTRAGMGRCQAGFCGARVLEILARELGVRPTEVTLKGGASRVLAADTRGART